MTEHTPDLLPCPFCGGVPDGPHFIRDGRLIACRCGSSVIAFHGKYNTDERVTEFWNRRSPDLLAENTRLREVNAGLVEALKDMTYGLPDLLESIGYTDEEDMIGKALAALRAAEDVA